MKNIRVLFCICTMLILQHTVLAIDTNLDLTWMDIKTESFLPSVEINRKSVDIIGQVELKPSSSNKLIPEILEKIQPVSLAENFKALAGGGAPAIEIAYFDNGAIPFFSVKAKPFNPSIDDIVPKMPAQKIQDIPGDTTMLIKLPAAPSSGLIVP